MTIKEFLDHQSDESRKTFTVLHALIQSHDSKVVSSVGSIMSVKEAIIYKEAGVFKYGLTATKNHFSYHSMVMYAYPETLTSFKSVSKNIKFLKGCFNFKSLADINVPALEQFLHSSSNQDFSKVIHHYKKRKK